MKTAISLDDQTFHAAEAYAQKAGMSRSELYATALRRFLKEQEDAAITEKLNAIYGPMGGEDPETAEFRKEAARRAFERSEW